jgi:hypothetical protein
VVRAKKATSLSDKMQLFDHEIATTKNIHHLHIISHLTIVLFCISVGHRVRNSETRTSYFAQQYNSIVMQKIQDLGFTEESSKPIKIILAFGCCLKVCDMCNEVDCGVIHEIQEQKMHRLQKEEVEDRF